MWVRYFSVVVDIGHEFLPEESQCPPAVKGQLITATFGMRKSTSMTLRQDPMLTLEKPPFIARPKCIPDGLDIAFFSLTVPNVYWSMVLLSKDRIISSQDTSSWGGKGRRGVWGVLDLRRTTSPTSCLHCCQMQTFFCVSRYK